MPPRSRKPAPRPGRTVRNGRKTAGQTPQVDINIDRSRYVHVKDSYMNEEDEQEHAMIGDGEHGR